MTLPFCLPALLKKNHRRLICPLLCFAASPNLFADQNLPLTSPIKALLPDDFFLQKQAEQHSKNQNPPADNFFENSKTGETDTQTFSVYVGSHLQPSYVDKFASISAIVPTDKDNESFLISPTFGFKLYILPNLLLDAQTDLGYFRLNGSEFQNFFDSPSNFYIKEDNVPLRTDASLKFLF